MGNLRHPRGLDFRIEHFVPSPSTYISSPAGALIFGRIPRIVDRSGELIECGDIYLRFGEHWGPNRGYGVHHILQEHRQILKFDENPVCGVARFVASVLQPKADIHCEFSNMRGRHRPIVIRRPHGQVVLEPLKDKSIGEYYSVITAIPSTKAKGPRVGAL